MTTVISLQSPTAPLDRRGRPMHDLRISVMDRCNFRCPYCMPKETFGEGYRFLGTAERLSFAEITRLAGLFVDLGVRKLRLTGGEPLLRAGLEELVGDLAALPGVEDVALTTNGILLGRHARELHAQGLARVTVSLDSLDPGVFRAMSGGYGCPTEVLEGIDVALAAGLAPIKVNCVVQRGVNDHTLLDLVERFRGTPVVVRFIEYRTSATATTGIAAASCRRRSCMPRSRRAGRSCRSRPVTTARSPSAMRSPTARARSASSRP